MSAVIKQSIRRNLHELVREYEVLDAERTFLMDGVADRLAAVVAARADIVGEAQEQLNRLNALVVADGGVALSLQEIRQSLGRPRRPANQ
jgi:hypothetical protein